MIEFWEREKIGFALLGAGIVMFLFNRMHRYIPIIKYCWDKGERSVLFLIPKKNTDYLILENFSGYICV